NRESPFGAGDSRSLPAVCVSECTLTPAGPEPAGEATQTTVASDGSLDQPPDSMSWFLYPVVNVAHFFSGADRLPQPAIGSRLAPVRSQPDRSSPASAPAACAARVATTGGFITARPRSVSAADRTPPWLGDAPPKSVPAQERPAWPLRRPGHWSPARS